MKGFRADKGLQQDREDFHIGEGVFKLVKKVNDVLHLL
jgi:hypothetical protein